MDVILSGTSFWYQIKIDLWLLEVVPGSDVNKYWLEQTIN